MHKFTTSKVRKEDKQVKQHDYVTSSQSDEGLNYHKSIKMFNFVRTTVYYTLLCVNMLRVYETKEIRK